MPFLFAITLFVSATLLFLVQPMIAKMVLPLLGGTPAVWNTCMVFFQAALLAGYAYSHALSSRLSVRRQLLWHILLLFIPFFGVLPISIAGWTPPRESNPIPWLLLLLSVSIGLPFFVLSTSAPLLQKWFASTGHPAGKDPYFLYAASNLGSMLALLTYPTLVEPNLPLKPFAQISETLREQVWLSQSWLWAAGYGLFVVLMVACAQAVWKSLRNERAVRKGHKGGAINREDLHEIDGRPRPDALTRWRWIGLAFVPSSLMLGVTTHITLDIAAIPLLWVLPLTLYLLSFILVFAKWPAALHRGVVLATPLLVLMLAFMMQSGEKLIVTAMIIIHLVVLFAVALVCHGELARTRPATRYLTEFYLLMSVGGVLGGLFNAIIAPLIFRGVYEYPLALVGACLLIPAIFPKRNVWLSRWFPEGWSGFAGVAADILFAALLGLVAYGLLVLSYLSAGEILASAAPHGRLVEMLANALGNCHDGFVNGISWIVARVNAIGLFGKQPRLTNSALLKIIAYGLPTLLCYLYVARPLRFGLAVAGFFMAGISFNLIHYSKILHQDRSFFGVMKVEYDKDENSNELVHGTTLHGKQIRTPEMQSEPITYYHRTGPIGQMFESFQKTGARRHVAVIGLGSGTMACYGEAGMRMTFYDIDPAVVRIAQNPEYFTYWTDCKAEKNIILGDARLRIEEADDKQYDLIVVDAFSSDSIPIHLITREAIQLYCRKLADHGVIAVHISNRYLDLRPVVGNLVADLKLHGRFQYDEKEDDIEKAASEWAVLAKNREALGSLAGDERWKELEKEPGIGVWTDDFSNLLGVFEWKNQ